VHFWVNILALFLLFIMFRAMVVLSLWAQDGQKSKGMIDTRNINIERKSARIPNLQPY